MSEGVMMDLNENYEDMSWLTQVLSQSSNVMYSQENSDDEIDGISLNYDSIGDTSVFDQPEVNLEENYCLKAKLLYNEVFAEDISLDDDIDKM